MDSLTYEYKQINFANLMKAQLRKYFDEIYKDKTIITDMSRRFINKDMLEIYRVHCFEFMFKTKYLIERIIIDRKNKTYQSWINSFQYVEECNYSEVEGGVKYIQKYSVPFFVRSKKEKVFKIGCEVVEKIINSDNLRC
jgi:hypothetical protein